MVRLCCTFRLILGVLAMALLVSPGLSLTCTSQKFSNNNFYPNCADLPHLNAYLHWNFSASNSSLSMAFVASPAKTDGWVSWAINPNSTGMVGAQALLALKSNGSMTIKTYDIKSYMFNMSGLKLSYEVWDLSAEDSNGTIKIFGKWKLPAKTEKVNQVWQVGPGVTPQGWPIIHDRQPENLEAKGTLNLVAAEAASPAPEPASSGGSNGVSRIRDRLTLGFYMPFFVILGSLIVF